MLLESAIIGDARKRHTHQIHLIISYECINCAKIGVFCLTQILTPESRITNSETYWVQTVTKLRDTDLVGPGVNWMEMTLLCWGDIPELYRLSCEITNPVVYIF